MGSRHGLEHREIVERFLVSIILVANNCSSSSRLCYNNLVKEMFGYKRGLPSQSTLSCLEASIMV